MTGLKRLMGDCYSFYIFINAQLITLSSSSTLFVSNLPYTATSVDLQTLFSDIAPVRSAFVVTEHGTGVSKGVGYVSFALKEDAETAFESISQSGIDLVGRKLRVQWAENKVRCIIRVSLLYFVS
jgi:nucleolar protein 4